MNRLLFGGTFDPVHLGHLQWAEHIRQRAGAAGLSLLPCADPPHRRQTGADAGQRCAMLNLALRDFPALHMDTLELQLPAPSYAVQTLQALHAREPESTWFWCMGMDSFLSLAQWHQPEKLLQLTNLVVLARPGYLAETERMAPLLRDLWQQRQPLTPHSLQNCHSGALLIVDGEEYAYSATHIRAELRAGRRYPSGLQPAVADYIAQHGLYSS